MPILEKNFESREGFAQYKAETNVFIPWIPKKYIPAKEHINILVPEDDKKEGYNSNGAFIDENENNIVEKNNSP